MIRRVPLVLWLFAVLVVATLVGPHVGALLPGAPPVNPTAHAPVSRRARRRQADSQSHIPPPSAAAALRAAGGPVAVVQTVAAPGRPGVQWALDPLPAAGRWWFGVQTHSVWRWAGVAATEPLPRWWPLAPRRVLADAAALQDGAPLAGPTVGAAPWNTVTGHVGAPLC